MSEMWLPVIGYESLYEVSSFGRVRSIDRQVNAMNSSKRVSKGKYLKQSLNGRGYFQVGLSNGKSRSVVVHRLVATAFLCKSSKSDTVNHKDGIKTNNNINNLEWCTYGENNRHAIDTGLRVIKSGIESPNYGKVGARKGMKANRDSVEKMRASKTGVRISGSKVMHVESGTVFRSIVEAALFYGINRSCLAAQLRGQNKNKSGLVFL